MALIHTTNTTLWTSVYKFAALLVSRAFRTVSDQAFFVIAGMVPIDLMATKPSLQVMMVCSQYRRETSTKEGWTYSLIPGIMYGILGSWIFGLLLNTNA